MNPTRLNPDGLATRIIVALLSTVALAGSASAADHWPSTYRVQHSIGKFGETSGSAVAFYVRAPRPLRAHHLEVAAGTLISASARRS